MRGKEESSGVGVLEKCFMESSLGMGSGALILMGLISKE